MISIGWNITSGGNMNSMSVGETRIQFCIISFSYAIEKNIQ